MTYNPDQQVSLDITDAEHLARYICILFERCHDWVRLRLGAT
jgi:hypothetical protein